DADAQRLADRLLRSEATGVVLRRVRLRVAVGALVGGEAAFAEAVAVALQGAAYAFDLDQVEPDAHYEVRSSQSGSCAIEERIASGCTPASSTASGRNLPVRTRTVRMPCRCAPITSPS